MSRVPEAPADPSRQTYIRGGGGVEIKARKVLAIIVAICLAVLIGVIAELTVSAAHRNDQITRLQQSGVPVRATVTGCLAITSGIGMGVEFYQCNGAYSLGGHEYNEVIGGSRTHLQTGQTLAAVVDPGRPTVIWDAAALARQHTSWTDYIPPAALTLVVILVAGGWVFIRRRRKRAPVSGAGVPVPA
jgi:hypothetical protein